MANAAKIIGVPVVKRGDAAARKTKATSSNSRKPANDSRLTNIGLNRSLQRSKVQSPAQPSTPAKMQRFTQAAANRNHPVQQAVSKKTAEQTDIAASAARIVKTTMVGAEITLSYLLPYAFQFTMGMLFFATYYLEMEWHWLSILLPAKTIMAIAWIIGAAIGTFFLISALLTFEATVTRLNRSFIWIAFALCFAGNIAPYIFIFPWTLVWVGVVIIDQK